MSLRDEVELDVSSALRQIDRLGASLTQQTQQFSRELARSLDNLRVEPKVSTAGLQRTSTAAKQVASDVSKITKETEAATAATGKYGRTLQGIAQIRVVQGLVAFFGGRALVGQITDTVDAAAALNEQVAQSGQIFGDSQSEIRSWAEGAVESVALARREALQFANDFGAMFRGFGAGEEQAASMSKTFVQLGADIASFKDVPIQEALVALRAGLAGENEPLRRLGFGFNDLEVKAKAAALGIHAVNGQLTTSQKAQALTAVILEKTALAQGDLARTGDSLTNQQRKLSAQISQLKEDVGAALAPAFLDLVEAMRENLPIMGEIAERLFPALISAFRAILPIGIAFADMLATISPILTLVATILDHLPGPILQAGIAFALFGTGIGPLPNLLKQYAAGVEAARVANGLIAASGGVGSISTVAAGFSAMNPAVLALTVALPVLTTIFGNHARQQARLRAEVTKTTQAFEDQSKTIAESVAQRVGEITPSNQIDDLNRIFGSDAFAKVGELAGKGADGLREFVDEALRAGELKLGQGLDSVTQALKLYGSIQNAVVQGGITGNISLIRTYEKIAQVVSAAAKEELDRLQATGSVKPDVIQSAIAANTVDGVTNFVAALDDVRPAAKAAGESVLDFGASGEEATSAMDDLDKALKAVKDTLDETFGRFLDAQDATAKLQDATFSLAEAMAEGAKKGEAQVEFQRRLSEGAREVARAIEDRAVALARSGQIGSDAASVEAEMRSELVQQIALFPQLREQLQAYVDLLGPDSLPRDVTTQAHFSVGSNEIARVTAWGKLVREAVDPKPGEHMANITGGLVEDLTAGLGPIADAGAAAGRAAAEAAADAAETTLRHSGRPGHGLDIAGFIVEGINLGAAGAARDIRNFVNGATDGLQGVVQDAMKIDPSEAQEILQAVADMDQATRDLAKARQDFGADSIEAAIATARLADAQQHVNDVIIEATDSTKAYNDALKDVRDSVDSVTGGLRALQAVRDAQKAKDDAAKVATQEGRRLGLFDTLISQQEQALADAKARRIAAGGTDPSVEEQRIQASLTDLRNRQIEQQGKVADANAKVTDANLDLIDATGRLVELGPQLVASQGLWEGYFRSIGASAGLAAGEIQHLVDVITYTNAFIANVASGALSGHVVPIVPQTGVKAAAYTTASAGTPVPGKTINNTFYITGDGGRGTALDVVDEIRASEMV